MVSPIERDPDLTLPMAPRERVRRDRFYARCFAIAATLLLGAALYLILLPFVVPSLWAVLLALLAHPLHLRITRWVGGRANLSAALVTLLATVFLLGPVAALGAALVSQSGELMQWAQSALLKGPNAQYRVLVDLPFVEPLVRWMTEDLGIRTDLIRSWVAQGTDHLPKMLSELGGKMFLGAFNTAVALVVMLFMLFFLVRDGAGFVALLRDLVPLSPRRRHRLMDHLAGVMRAVVYGTGITVVVQGSVVGIGFFITGLAAPVVFGALAAVLALLPFGGTAFVWIPATLVLAGNGDWPMALAMGVIGIISSTIDNVLRPFLIAGGAEVNPLLVFVGVMGGAAAFGPVGMVAGPVLLALIAAMMRFARESQRRG